VILIIEERIIKTIEENKLDSKRELELVNRKKQDDGEKHTNEGETDIIDNKKDTSKSNLKKKKNKVK